jgi:hypothetical protein
LAVSTYSRSRVRRGRKSRTHRSPAILVDKLDAGGGLLALRLLADGSDLKSAKDWVRFAKTSPVLTASALAAFEVSAAVLVDELDGGPTPKTREILLGSFRKKRRRRFSPLLLWRLSKAQAWSATVLVDELDAGRLERLANDFQRRPSWLARSGLELMDRHDAHPGRIGKFLLAPRQETTSCSALGGVHHGSYMPDS